MGRLSVGSDRSGVAFAFARLPLLKARYVGGHNRLGNANCPVFHLGWEYRSCPRNWHRFLRNHRRSGIHYRRGGLCTRRGRRHCRISGHWR